MSLLKEYLRERTDIEMIETQNGFIVYSIDGEECYIRDIYVVPDQRKKHLAKDLADQVTQAAAERGCKYLIGSVCPGAKGADNSLKVLQAYGMKLHAAKENLILFKKDIYSWEV